MPPLSGGMKDAAKQRLPSKTAGASFARRLLLLQIAGLPTKGTGASAVSLALTDSAAKRRNSRRGLCPLTPRNL